MKERWPGLLGSGGVLWKRVRARDAGRNCIFFLSIFPGCCHSQWEAALPCPCTSPGVLQALLKSQIISPSTPKRLHFLKSSAKDHRNAVWRDVKPLLLPRGGKPLGGGMATCGGCCCGGLRTEYIPGIPAAPEQQWQQQGGPVSHQGGMG